MAAKGLPDVDTGPVGFGLIPIVSPGRDFAESFTAGRTGFLDTLEVVTSQYFGFGGRFEVKLTGVTTDGAPNETVLASAAIDICSLASTTGSPTATFSPAPAVTAGQRYAVVVRYTDDSRLGNQGVWYPGTTMPEGGGAWTRSPGTSPDWEGFGFGTPAAEPFTLATYVSASQPALAGRDATTTSVSATPHTGKRRQPVALTATVADQANPDATPAGDVTFLVDGVPDGGGSLDSTGRRRATISFDTVGDHSIRCAVLPQPRRVR